LSNWKKCFDSSSTFARLLGGDPLLGVYFLLFAMVFPWGIRVTSTESSLVVRIRAESQEPKEPVHTGGPRGFAAFKPSDSLAALPESAREELATGQPEQFKSFFLSTRAGLK
jgi:hypothetical protein